MEGPGKATLERDETGGTMKRRGVIAGAAALVAGTIAAQAAQTVDAANGDTVTVGGSFTGTATTQINGQVPTGVPFPPPSGMTNSSGATFLASNSTTGANYSGILDATRDGIQGYANNANVAPPAVSQINSGVSGRNDDLNGTGVSGVGSNGIGVYAQTELGAGLTARAGSSGYGVYSTSSTGIGVYGQTDSGSFGVKGQAGSSAGSIGVYGNSTTGYGVLGISTAPGFAGLTGISTIATIPAFAGGNNAPNGAAAIFNGNIFVYGNSFVSGTKSAMVPFADGSQRLVYCTESPESWFEDFGKAKLIGGKADVKIDADFAQIVHTDDYHVFPVAYGDSKGLYVTNQTATGFTVREAQNGTSNLTFSYRIVAKRKDVTAARLAKVEAPKVNFTVPAAPVAPAPVAPFRPAAPKKG